MDHLFVYFLLRLPCRPHCIYAHSADCEADLLHTTRHDMKSPMRFFFPILMNFFLPFFLSDVTRAWNARATLAADIAQTLASLLTPRN
jgi:hypothetical protein